MSHVRVRDPWGASEHESQSSFCQRLIGAVWLEPGAWPEILDDAASVSGRRPSSSRAQLWPLHWLRSSVSKGR